MRGARGWGWAVVALAALAPRAALALDAFEIQVYDGTADPQGGAGLELHVNDVARGLTTAPAPELPPNHQAHFTLEPSYGVLPFWELGGYFQTALRADGTFDFAGVKARTKFVTPPSWSTRVRLGVNLEVSDLPRRYEAARWGFETRPIAAWEGRHVSLAVNPIVDVALTSGETSFEPAAQALFKVPGLLTCGLEYYASLGALTHTARFRDEEHYLFEVVNLANESRWELNVGVGEGLTPSSNDLVVKAIIGYQLDVLGSKPRSQSASE